nr:MAG TPA: hypothetical protein [Caudoviricetes sp.]
MTETNTAITEAIVKCDEIKARLETLRDMLKPKPVLRLESIARPGHTWELRCAGDLDCPEGTVIEGSDGWRYYRLADGRSGDWMSDNGQEYTHGALWETLIQDAANHVTFEYSGNF